jgi:hypothetical protein
LNHSSQAGGANIVRSYVYAFDVKLPQYQATLITSAMSKIDRAPVFISAVAIEPSV